MSKRLGVFVVAAFTSFLFAGCGTTGGGGGGSTETGGTTDDDACMAAKQHLCDNITGQGCSTSTMGNAKAKVSAACSAASTTAFFPWIESACAAKTMNCAALPKYTTPGTQSCAQAQDFHYSGTATADGRSASLDLTLKGTTVKGTLHADPVCQPSIHLTRTDFTFTATLSGKWEADGSSINGSWSGGDYDCDGKIMAGYPTAGTVSIVLSGAKVSLKRISNGWEYLFGPSGTVYVPASCPDAGSSDTVTAD